MATYDLLMLVILVGLTLYGYFKGMAWQVAYIASFVASYFVAVRYADQVAPKITFVNAPANKFVAMLLIYIATSFVVWMLFRVVSKAIDSVRMEGFDHQMGAIIGFGRGVLWCVGVTFFAVTLPVLPGAQKQQIVASQSGRYIATLLNETDAIFPPEIHQVIDPYLNRLENELSPAGPWQAGQPGAGGQPPAQASPWSVGGGGAAPAQADSGWGWNEPPRTAPSNPAPSRDAAWPPAASSASRNTEPSRSTQPGWPPRANAPTPAQPASWPQW